MPLCRKTCWNISRPPRGAARKRPLSPTAHGALPMRSCSPARRGSAHTWPERSPVCAAPSRCSSAAPRRASLPCRACSTPAAVTSPSTTTCRRRVCARSSSRCAPPPSSLLRPTAPQPSWSPTARRSFSWRTDSLRNQTRHSSPPFANRSSTLIRSTCSSPPAPPVHRRASSFRTAR